MVPTPAEASGSLGRCLILAHVVLSFHGTGALPIPAHGASPEDGAQRVWRHLMKT